MHEWVTRKLHVAMYTMAMNNKLNLIRAIFNVLVLYQTEYILTIISGGSGSWFK